MELIKNISEALARIARARVILPAILVLIVILGFMEYGPSGKGAFAKASGGEGMLDMSFGYGQARLYELFARLGVAGREVYARLLGLDFLFALSFAFAQSLMLSALMRKASFPAGLRSLNLLPWLRSALDLVENVLLLCLLGAFTARRPGLAAAATTATVLKWLAFYCILALFLFLGARSTMAARAARKPAATKEASS